MARKNDAAELEALNAEINALEATVERLIEGQSGPRSSRRAHPCAQGLHPRGDRAHPRCDPRRGGRHADG